MSEWEYYGLFLFGQAAASKPSAMEAIRYSDEKSLVVLATSKQMTPLPDIFI